MRTAVIQTFQIWFQLLDRDENHPDEMENSQTRSPLHLAVSPPFHFSSTLPFTRTAFIGNIFVCWDSNKTPIFVDDIFSQLILRLDTCICLCPGIPWSRTGSRSALGGSLRGGSGGWGGSDSIGPCCPQGPQRLRSHTSEPRGLAEKQRYYTRTYTHPPCRYWTYVWWKLNNCPIFFKFKFKYTVILSSNEWSYIMCASPAGRLW